MRTNTLKQDLGDVIKKQAEHLFERFSDTHDTCYPLYSNNMVLIPRDVLNKLSIIPSCFYADDCDKIKQRYLECVKVIRGIERYTSLECPYNVRLNKAVSDYENEGYDERDLALMYSVDEHDIFDRINNDYISFKFRERNLNNEFEPVVPHNRYSKYFNKDFSHTPRDIEEKEVKENFKCKYSEFLNDGEETHGFELVGKKKNDEPIRFKLKKY